MGIIHRIAGALRYGPNGHPDPAASLATDRWRQRAALTSVQRDLDEATDEQAYVEAEIARSRDYAARLATEAAAATADGCAEVARELDEELIQAHAFLAELAEVRSAVIADRNRLSSRRNHLADRLAQSDTPTETVAAESTTT